MKSKWYFVTCVTSKNMLLKINAFQTSLLCLLSCFFCCWKNTNKTEILLQNKITFFSILILKCNLFLWRNSCKADFQQQLLQSWVLRDFRSNFNMLSWCSQKKEKNIYYYQCSEQFLHFNNFMENRIPLKSLG